MYIASIACDVKIHNWPSGQLVNAYKASNQSSHRTISWGKDGNWLVVVPTKGPAEVVCIRDNSLKHLYTIEDIQQPTCATFQNLTKRYIALGTNTGNILVYDIKTKSVRKHFPRASSTVFRIEYGMRDNYLLTAAENGEISLYNSTTLNCSQSYKVPNSKTVTTIGTHPHRRFIFMGGSEEGVVAVWDLTQDRLMHSNQTHQAMVTDVSFSPIRQDLVVSCGLDRKFSFWDTTSNSLVLQKVLDCSPTSIDFCPDGVGLAVGTQAGSIYLYDTRHMNDPMYTFKAHNSHVKQMLFQKDCVDESGDYGFQSERDGAEVVHGPVENPIVKGFDSFGSMLYDGNGGNNGNHAEPIASSCSDIQQDSFLDAMGISGSMKDSNYGPISKGVKKLLDSKPNLLDSRNPNLLDSRNPEASPAREEYRDCCFLEGGKDVCKDSTRESSKVTETEGDCVKQAERECHSTEKQPLRDTRTSQSPHFREYLRDRDAGDAQSSNQSKNFVREYNSKDPRRISYGGGECFPKENIVKDTHLHEDTPLKDENLYRMRQEYINKSREAFYYTQGQSHQDLRKSPVDYNQTKISYATVEIRPVIQADPRVVIPTNLKPAGYNHTTVDDVAPVNVPLENIKQQHSSTPKIPQPSKQFLEKPVPMFISPIIGQGPNSSTRPIGVEIADFHNTIRQAVKQEVKAQLDIFHQSLKYDIMEVLAQIRRNFLDMQMSIVKEFVQLESSLNRVRDDLSNDESTTDDLLIQENIRLRKELALLRDQVIKKEVN